MTSVPRRFDRCRSSKRFCAEKLCCKSEKAEATFHCDDCNTDQCYDCVTSIHQHNSKFEFHDRSHIVPTSFELLCQISTADSSRQCTGLNFADLHCEICNINFCFTCFEFYHRGPRRTHRKTSFKDFKARESQRNLETIVKPISPVDTEDTSLTFVSCPQIQIDQEVTSSMDSFNSVNSRHSQNGSIPDLCLNSNEKDIINIEEELAASQIDEYHYNSRSFMLLDGQEKLQVDDVDDFLIKLGCDEDEQVKVVSIFGNTGDGKSYTMNHTFFSGKEVFKTSAHQDSCTIGVWASYDPITKAIVIDTEGFLGVTANQNQRSRLLLKILAVSDVVIYRTRAERLHNDMFQFLCDASTAYTKHFSLELQAAAKRCGKSTSDLHPSVIIFHETTNTRVLGEDNGGKPAESDLLDKFQQLDCHMYFKDLKYIGTRTKGNKTDFKKFQAELQQQLENKSHRAARRPEVVYTTLKNLNDKFSGEIEKPVYGTFPDQMFTCSVKCLCCGESCCLSMNHKSNQSHNTDKRCKYQHQFGNKVYLCKRCWMGGKQNVVVLKTSESKDNAWMGFAKYVWAGEVLECPHCGVIYRSREKWYGNSHPEEAVTMDIRHVWPDGLQNLQGAQNAARKLVDGIHYIADSISSVGSGPTKMLSDWMADKIAPEYWVPNAQIKECSICSVKLENEQKHHCRACGKGFCDSCSSHRRPVPERGWGENETVRVCDNCFQTDAMAGSADSTGSNSQTTARRVGEAVTSAIGVAASTFNYPLGMLKDTARPAYWVPDADIKSCCVCKEQFGPKRAIHHCRACGKGVCETCSPNKLPVPIRGWDYPVRVCTKCEKKADELGST